MRVISMITQGAVGNGQSYRPLLSALNLDRKWVKPIVKELRFIWKINIERKLKLFSLGLLDNC